MRKESEKAGTFSCTKSWKQRRSKQEEENKWERQLLNLLTNIYYIVSLFSFYFSLFSFFLLSSKAFIQDSVACDFPVVRGEKNRCAMVTVTGIMKPTGSHWKYRERKKIERVSEREREEGERRWRRMIRMMSVSHSSHESCLWSWVTHTHIIWKWRSLSRKEEGSKSRREGGKQYLGRK